MAYFGAIAVPKMLRGLHQLRYKYVCGGQMDCTIKELITIKIKYYLRSIKDLITWKEI